MPIKPPEKVRISPKAVSTVGSIVPIGGTKKAVVIIPTVEGEVPVPIRTDDCPSSKPKHPQKNLKKSRFHPSTIVK